MSTGEDESSPGLNGRLRPRRCTISTPSPQNKSTRKSEGKHAEDKLKKTTTPSKTLPSKQDDLTAKSDNSSAPLFLCPYCDRKFTSKQTASKHARRMHLSTSRQDNFIQCLYCNHSEAEGNEIIKHMVDNHPNQYFACLNCFTRFSVTIELAEHKHNVCEKQKPTYRSKLRQKSTSGTKNNSKRSKALEKIDIQNENAECADEHRFNGIVISCELKPSQTHDEGDIEDNLTTNLILPPSKTLGKSVMEKSAVIVLDDIQWNKRIPQNFSFHNTDADQILSRLGVVHRSPRVGESTKKDWIKIRDESTQKFERCFDTNFYSKVAKNVQENLTKYLDGTINFNPNKENTIKTRKSKTGVAINTAEGFPILLAYEQFSRNLLDGYMPRPLAPKHKWKWDNAETDKNVVMLVDDSKRDSHVNNCIVTLVSSLDIWTQLQMRRKFEEVYKTTPTAKKTEKQNIISRELKEILESRDIPSYSSQIVEYQRSPAVTPHKSELPAHLGLSPVTPTCELKPAVLSGEWVRPRCYVCCACGEQTDDARTLSSHISTQHPNAQVQHYEIVGETLLSADILKHLYVPPSQMSNRTRPPRGFRDCTKCKKSITLEDLHQHMLDCAGDTPTVRRKCRYRPFGVRKRRPRLPDNTIRKKMRKDIGSRHRQKCHLRTRPRIRTEVGDAETIRKMIADLPAKRNRISLPISRPRRNILTAKKVIKLRATEDKTAKVRPANKITRLKKTVALKKSHSDLDNSSNIDEDDQPLKSSSKRDSTKTLRKRDIPNKNIAKKANKSCFRNRTNYVQNVDKKNCSKSKKSAVSIEDISIHQSLNPFEHQKVDVNGAGPSSYVREHSNRSNSKNEESSDRRPTGERNDENKGNNITPLSDLPSKQCVGNATFNAESLEQNLFPNDRNYLPEPDTEIVPRMVSDHHLIFENEVAVTKFDKPPLKNDKDHSLEPVCFSKEKLKLSKTKNRLEDCIAMLKNKKGLPESDKNESKPDKLNIPIQDIKKLTEEETSNPKPTSIVPVLLEQNVPGQISINYSKTTNQASSTTSESTEATEQVSDTSYSEPTGQASAESASEAQGQTQTSEMSISSSDDTHHRKPPMDYKYVLPKENFLEIIPTDISPLRRSPSQNGAAPAVSSSTSKTLELPQWMPLPVAGDIYSDFNPMRRSSYDPTITSAHPYYLNPTQAMSVQQLPNFAHLSPHIRIVDGKIYYLPTYNPELYTQQLKTGFPTENTFLAPYGTLHHGQPDASHNVLTSTLRSRREPKKKEVLPEPQKQRKQKRTPDKHITVSPLSHKSSSQINASPDKLTSQRSLTTTVSSDAPVHVSKSTAFRVHRESQKRTLDSAEFDINMALSRDDIVQSKIMRKSPRPENTSMNLQHVRRHSMDVGAPHYSKSINYDAGMVHAHRGLYDRDLKNISPNSRGRSESRTSTPDTRSSVDEKMRQDLTKEIHSNNSPYGWPLTHGLQRNIDSAVIAAQNDQFYATTRNYDKQVEDAVSLRNRQYLEYYYKHFHNMATKNENPNIESYMKDSEGGKNTPRNQQLETCETQQLNNSTIQDNELHNMQQPRNRPGEKLTLGDNFNNTNNPTDVYHLIKTPNTNVVPQSISVRNLSETSDLSMHKSPKINNPLLNVPKNLLCGIRDSGRYSKNNIGQVSSFASAHCHSSNYNSLYTRDTNATDIAERKQNDSLIPLDLTRKERNIEDSTTKTASKIYTDPINEKRVTDEIGDKVESVSTEEVFRRSIDINDIIDAQNDTPDSTQSISVNTITNPCVKAVNEHFNSAKVTEQYFQTDIFTDNSNLQLNEKENNKEFLDADVTNTDPNDEEGSAKQLEVATLDQENQLDTVNNAMNTDLIGHPIIPIPLRSGDEMSKTINSKTIHSNICIADPFQSAHLNNNTSHLSINSEDDDNIQERVPDISPVASSEISDNSRSEPDTRYFVEKKQNNEVIVESNKNYYEILPKDEIVSKVDVSSHVPERNIMAQLSPGNLNVDQGDDKIVYEEDGLKLDIAELERLMSKKETQLNNDETVTDKNSDDYKILASALSKCNLVVMINLLAKYPKLMDKIKTAIVNGVVALSPTTPDSTAKNDCDQFSTAVSSSCIIPKKRHSPSQPFARSSSSESCSTSSDLRTSNLPSSFQLPKQNIVSNEISPRTYDYEENADKQSDKVLEFSHQVYGSALTHKMSDEEADAIKINLVDDSNLLPKNTYDNKNVLLAKVSSQDLATKVPIKQKTFKEQTASLRAVRIKTPLSRKSDSDDKNFITMSPNNIHQGSINKIICATQSNTTSFTISANQSGTHSYDQSNYKEILEKQDISHNNAITSDNLNENISALNSSNLRVSLDEAAETKNKIVSTEEPVVLKNENNVYENISLTSSYDLPVKSLSPQSSDNIPCSVIQESHSSNILAQDLPEVNLVMGDVNNGYRVNLESIKTINLLEDNHNTDCVIQAEAEKIAPLNTSYTVHTLNNDTIIGDDVLPPSLIDAQDKTNDTIPNDFTMACCSSTNNDNNQILVNASDYIEEQLRKINSMESKTLENSKISSSNSATIIDSPKNKKSDGDDSEDDVSLADILKKRNSDNSCVSNNSVMKALNIEKTQEKDMGKLAFEENQNKDSMDYSDVLNNMKVSPSAERIEVFHSSANEEKIRNDVDKEYKVPSKTRLSCVNTAVDGSYDCKLSTILYNDTNDINECDQFTYDKIISDDKNKEYDCGTTCVLGSDLNMSIDQDRNTTYEMQNNENLSKLKENYAKPLKEVGTENIRAEKISHSRTINELISTSEKEGRLPCLEDFKPCGTEYETLAKSSISNDSKDPLVSPEGLNLKRDLQMCPEISDVNLVPLRRSRRGKSMYADSTQVEDYDYAVLEDVEESRKMPLTMKRLILSRVEKDNNGSKLAPANVHHADECNRDQDVSDTMLLTTTELSDKINSNKVQPSKRKQSTNTKRKTKKSKSANKQTNDEDFSDVPILSDSDKVLQGLSKTESTINENEGNDDETKSSPCTSSKIKEKEGDDKEEKPSTDTTSPICNRTTQINIKKDIKCDAKSLKIAKQIGLTGKRKKNISKTLLSKSKKAKYTKTRTCSDFDSEDDKDLTEIKQKHAAISCLRSEDEQIKNVNIVDTIVCAKKDIDRLHTANYCDDNFDFTATGAVNISGETRTACYNRPILNRKSRLPSVSKKERVDYDPYDIDLEDMIETAKPVLKKKCKNSHTKVKNHKTFHRNNLDTADKNKSSLKNSNSITLPKSYIRNDNSDSDSDSSKSDVPLQKYVNEKGSESDQKSKNKKKLNEEKFDDYDNTTKESSDHMVDTAFYEEDGSPVNSNSKSGSQTCRNKKPTRRSKKDDTSCETETANIDQNLNMNNNVSIGQSKHKHQNKEKKNRRTLAVYNDVDPSSVSSDVDQQLRSDKFMESFGFYSEKIPRKSNLLASKKISETFHNMISNESDDSYLGYKDIKPNKKSLLSEHKKSDEEDNNAIEESELSQNAENSVDQTSILTTEADESSFSNEHSDLSKNLLKISIQASDKCENEISLSQRDKECDHLQIQLNSSSREDTATKVGQISNDNGSLTSKTYTSNTEEVKLDTPNLNLSELHKTRDIETTKKTPKTTNKQIDKQIVIKSKMYPDIEEIDLLEDKFDKIKRKRRSQAVAAKQIQTVSESTASNKSRKQPERKKNPRNSKKKYVNSQVPTKGALKGFESIKISIPTQDLNMPPSVSPPRQQKRRRKCTYKRRKETSESGSTCSEYDDKGKSLLDKDVYEFKDNEDTELLELRPSTVMDRFRSIHNKNKVKNKDKGKGEKEKHKEKTKDRKAETKDKNILKDDKFKNQNRSMPCHEDEKFNDQERNKESMNEERNETYRNKIIEFKQSEKSTDYKKVTKRSTEFTIIQDVDKTHDERGLMQTTIFNQNEHSDCPVPGTSGFVPDRDDESDYESESSMAGGCIVYKSDEFNCLCQSDIESDESDVERACGRSNCVYKSRNADKNAAIGNIFKNNAVRCDKNDIKDVEKTKPNLDQLFDSLLESKHNDDEFTFLSKSTPEKHDKSSFATDSWCHENDKNSKNNNILNKSRDMTSIFDDMIKNKTDDTDEISFRSGDESSVSKNNFDLIQQTSNIPNKSGLYMMVSTKSTQTGLPDDTYDTENEMTKNRHTDIDDDEFDINAKESDEWMVFQELVCPASKSSQTELTKLLYHCDEHIDCDLDCQSAFNKYLKDIEPSVVCVAVSTRATQTVSQGGQIHEQDTESLQTPTKSWNHSKNNFGVETIDINLQTDLINDSYLNDQDSDSDDNSCSEPDDRATVIEGTGHRKTSTSKDSIRSRNDRASTSISEEPSCSYTVPTSTGSRKSDEGIGTSHDCSADAIDSVGEGSGVARQRARRKCTVGKQNVLAEHWSSESEAETTPPRRNSGDSVVASVSKKKRGKKKEHGSGKKGSQKGAKKEKKPVHISSDESDSEAAGPSRKPTGPKMRAWARHHHYCSSDGEPPPPQHGWIVCDSHKKLVTMLAHAKGLRRNDDKRQLEE